MKEQLYNILEKLIVKNNIQINKEELKLQLSSHPSYPSLHALTGVLNHFGIPNLALRLVANKEILEQLPQHFIANVSTDNGDDLVLIEKKKDSIKITSDTKKSNLITKEAFLKQWNGIIVAIEKDDTIKEEVSKPLVKITKWSLITLSILLIGYTILTNNSVFAQSHFLLSIVGLIISVFILKHELGLQSSTANSFCNLSKKTSCDAVLNSKGASVFGLFKLSDISVTVFSCYCLCWGLFFINNTTNFSIMSIVTLLAFPFVIYSIYYQYKVVKKWCPLCLAIASVLILQIGALFLDDFSITSLSFNSSTSILFLIALTTVIGFWSFLKPLLMRKEALEKIEVEHYKFKRKFLLFNVLYNQGDSLSIFEPITGEISLGNPNAPVQMVLVTSPMCYYCKKAHSDIDYLLNRIGDKINVTIRFNVATSNQENQLYKIVSRLLEVYNIHGEKKILSVLDTVYGDDVDLGKWLKNQKYVETNTYDSVLEKQSDWCEANAISFTPALYINNKIFPQEYDRTDLIYFIDDLIEQQNISNTTNTEAIAS